MGGQMTMNESSRAEAASAAQGMWALGDYHRFAKELI
jgi:hypothetical protein